MLKKIYELIKKNPFYFVIAIYIISVVFSISSCILDSRNKQIEKLTNQNTELIYAITEQEKRIAATQKIGADLNAGINNIANQLFSDSNQAKKIDTDLREIIEESPQFTKVGVGDDGGVCFTPFRNSDLENHRLSIK